MKDVMALALPHDAGNGHGRDGLRFERRPHHLHLPLPLHEVRPLFRHKFALSLSHTHTHTHTRTHTHTLSLSLTLALFLLHTQTPYLSL